MSCFRFGVPFRSFFFFLISLFVCCPEISLVLVSLYVPDDVYVHKSNRGKWKRRVEKKQREQHNVKHINISEWMQNLISSRRWIKNRRRRRIRKWNVDIKVVCLRIVDADDAYLFISNFEHKSNYAAFTQNVHIAHKSCSWHNYVWTTFHLFRNGQYSYFLSFRRSPHRIWFGVYVRCNLQLAQIGRHFPIFFFICNALHCDQGKRLKVINKIACDCAPISIFFRSFCLIS